MMKKRILATVLSACMLTSMIGLAACGGGSNSGSGSSGTEYKYNVKSDTKLGIKVKNFGGGIGDFWLKEVAERFAELKQNEQYGNKTGVYIEHENTFTQSTSSMASDGTNIFFDERMSDPNSLAQSGLLLSLDSIVKDETREGGSLESKIFETAKGGIQGNDGSYYALPHYEFYTGLAYNHETFEKWNAFFAAEDEDNVYLHTSKYGKANFIGDSSATKSVGPDGVEGTKDDGLPRSLDEFILLCDYIKKESQGEVAPITLSGKYWNYAEYLMIGLWSSLAGAQQMKNYYNCTGEIEVVERDASGNLLYTNENLFEGISSIKKPKTKMVTMAEDGSQGWMGNDMAAKYYAMAMLDVIIDEGFLSATEKSSKDHWQAQMDLFMDGKMNTNNSAMLIDGSYWYNEANQNGGFAYYETFVGKDHEELDVRWMSLPTSLYAKDAAADEDKEACFLDCGQAYAMINGNVKNNPELMRACLEFLEFCYTDAELKNFTANTGLARAINYELEDSHKQNMSKYAVDLWERRDNKTGSNVVALSGTTDTFKKMKSKIKLDLGAGVLGLSIETRAWALIKNGTNVADVFKTCSLYGDWKL